MKNTYFCQSCGVFLEAYVYAVFKPFVLGQDESEAGLWINIIVRNLGNSVQSSSGRYQCNPIPVIPVM